MGLNAKSIIVIIIMIGFTFFSFPQAKCVRSSITIESSADTFVNSMYLHTQYPERPHGYLWGLYSGNMHYSAENVFGSARTYLKFNLSSITSDFQIASAILNIYIYDAPPTAKEFNIHMVYEDWDENQLIWINQPEFYATYIDSTAIYSHSIIIISFFRMVAFLTFEAKASKRSH